MSRNSGSIDRFRLFRSLELSIAGARTGSALIADKALNTLVRGRQHNPILEREAKRFVAKLGKMKGTYVKAGQMLALVGEHVLPAELTDALHSLEAATTPLPDKQVQQILRQRLGDAHEELDIDPTPLGVASLAQVHRATVKASGEEIVLKFLYPGIRASIDQDFKAVTRMLNLTRWLKISRGFDQWMEQIRQQLLCEVDYDHEIAMTKMAREQLSGDLRYRVPAIHERFCRTDLIAMSYEPGVPVTSSLVTELPQETRNQLAKSMLDLFFKEIFQWRHIQADPNFGNYRIAIEGQKVSLVLLDFGSVIHPGTEFCDAMIQAMTAAQSMQREPLVAALQRLGCLQADSSEHAQQLFADFCIEIMEPMRAPEAIPESYLNERKQYQWNQSGLMKRSAKIAARSLGNRNFDLPSEQFALVTRKLIGVFTFIATLDAEFNGADVLSPYLPDSVD